MPKPDNGALHRSLVKRRRALEKRLTAMEGKLEKVKDKPNASLLKRGMRAYHNSMVDLGKKLNRANPSYRAIEKQLRKLDDQIDTESERLSRIGK